MQLLYTEQDNILQCIQFAFVSYVRKSDVQHRKFPFVVYTHFDLSRLRLEFTPVVIVDVSINMQLLLVIKLLILLEL